MNTTTSVVIATYNGERFLSSQLKSILGQSDPADEIIVADDNSTDATISIVRHFMLESTTPIRLIRRRENVGFANNFALAALQATSDIIMFSDQDDVWGKDKIKCIKQWFTDHPDRLLVMHNIRICDTELRTKIPDYFAYLKKNHCKHKFLKGCATAIRKTLIPIAYPLPARSLWTHDFRVHAFARLYGSYGYIDDILMDYRIHVQQQCGGLAPSRSARGRILAQIDEWASCSWAAWLLNRGLLHLLESETKRNEFFNQVTALPDTLPESRFVARAVLIQNVIMRHPTLGILTSILELSRIFLRGGYRGVGGPFEYVLNVVRLIRRTA